jgi:hypothetical protein
VPLVEQQVRGFGPGTEELMMYRVLGFTCAVLALALLANGAVLAGKTDTHEGKLVSVKQNKITMEVKGGKEVSHDVAPTAKITCDGKDCKLSELKTNILIRVTVDDANRATRIEASTKGSLPKQQ